MQRRGSGAVLAGEQCCVAIEKLANAAEIASLRRQMDRMIRNCFGRSASKKLRDGFVTPVVCHPDEAAIVIAVRPRFEQDLHRRGRADAEVSRCLRPRRR